MLTKTKEDLFLGILCMPLNFFVKALLVNTLKHGSVCIFDQYKIRWLGGCYGVKQ